MKKSLIALSVIVLVVLIFSGSAAAIRFVWDASPEPEVIGYIFYWQSAEDPAPFNKNIAGKAAATYTVEDKFLKPNIAYDFWVTAYSQTMESDKSAPVSYMREVDLFEPPADNLPTTEYVYPAGTPEKIVNLKGAAPLQ